MTLLPLLAALSGCRPAPTAATPLPVPTGRLGLLRPVAALQLTGDRSFGGWSGAIVERQGDRRTLWAVNDQGGWVRLSLRTDAEDRLVGAEEVARGVLADETGAPLEGKELSDAEALVAAPDGWRVAFERQHRLWAYPDASEPRERRGPQGAARPVPLPPGFTAPENGGIEAAAAVEGGLALLVEGEAGDAGPHPGWVGGEEGWAPLRVERTGALRPVELSPMGPDLLLVERAFDESEGTTVRLSRLSGARLRSGEVLVPEELGVLRGPPGGEPGALPVDNFEAAALDGDTIWLLSDDNFSSAQRTLLLQLRWSAPEPAVSGARVERYPLDGRDDAELARSCAERCPRDEAGRPVRSLTDGSLRWTWDPVTRAEGCRVENVRAQVEIAVRLPSWEPPAGADPVLAARFPAYLEGLALHEQERVDRVHEAAREGSARLPEQPCDQAERAVQGWLAELRDRRARLDQDAPLGQLQGASLGPP